MAKKARKRAKAPRARKPKTKPVEYRSVDASAKAASYNHIAIANGFAFIAGHLAADVAKNPPPLGDIAVETRATMDVLKAVLADIGLGFGDVVRCTVYMTDLKEFDRMNAVYTSYFPKGRAPARTTFGAAALLSGCRVEIDCIARLRR